MSVASAKAYIERMKTDEEFAKKIVECKDADARIALAKQAGFDFTAEEIKAVLGELSDYELMQVAGGNNELAQTISDLKYYHQT